MATIRTGNKSVLLVVDPQVGVVKDAWDIQRIVKNVKHAVDSARQHKVPVIWVQHSDEQLQSGSPQWQWVPELIPLQDELQIHKHFHSSFEQTSLDQNLATMGASHIILAGAATNWCIRSTAYAALERGYDLTLVSDCHTTEDMLLADGSRIEASCIILELNVAMTWLNYPGRNNKAVSAKELSFEHIA